MAPKIEMKSSKLFKSFKSGDAIRSLSLRSSGNSCSQNTGPSNESTDFPQDAIMSAADIAKLVADGFRSGEDSGDDAFDAQSDGRASSNLEDDSDDDNDDGSDETSTVKDLDDSVGSKTHVLDSNMLLAKLGPSPTAEQIASLAATKAQEYIVECFGDESTILSKEQFDAIPRYVKSDLLIGQFLGKGSFSDAFEVTLNVNTKREPKRINTDGAGTDSDQNLDAILAAAAGQFSGVGGGASAHSLPSHERNFSVNAGGRRRARRASATNLSQSVCMGSMKNATWGGTTQMTLAMKCLRPQIRSNAEQFLVGVEDLIHETAILASLNHPNIIKIHGRSGGSVSDSFRLSDGYFILLDRLTDTLEDRIQRWKKAPRASKKSPSVNQLKVASSLAGAMLFLHQNHICFRDLKPANIGFNECGVLKLFDFGFAVAVDEENSRSLFEKCGTLRYMAPEVGLALGYGIEADVFSLGMILWEIAALKKPFNKVKSAAEFEALVFQKDTRPKIGKKWPKAYSNLISECWSRDAQQRPTTSVVKSILAAIVEEQSRRPTKSGSLGKSLRSSIARRVTWD